MDKINSNINEVILQGRIASMHATDKVTLMTISTGRATNIPNAPSVVCFPPLKTEVDQYKRGDYVKLTGYIQSSKRDPRIKNQQTLTIFGESISPAETELEKDFGVSGFFAVPVNRFRVAGLLVDISSYGKDKVAMTIKTVKGGHPSFVRMIKFTKTPEDLTNEFVPGDYVCAYGIVQTSKFEKNGETRHSQTFVVSEVSKCK